MKKNVCGVAWVYLSFSALVALVVYLYWPAIHGEFVWDDAIIVERHRIFVPQEWFHNSFQRFFMTREYYRPLPLFAMMLDGLWGEKNMPLAAHSTNVFIFCLNLLLVMLLVWRVSLYKLPAAILAGGIYAIHPALLESISWISGRCDLLVTFFILLALYMDIKLQSFPMRRMLVVCLCFFCAALSKEMAVTFPAVWLVWRLYIENVPLTRRDFYLWLTRERNALFLVALVFTGVFYLLFRFYMLGYIFSFEKAFRDVRYFGEISNRFFLVSKTLGWYLLLQVFPHYDLSAAYPTQYPVSIQDRASWMGVLIMLVFGFLLFTKKITSKVKCILLVSALLFLPISNIRPLSALDNFIQLRFLVLPISIAIVLIAPIFFDWFMQARKQLQVIVLAVGMLWCLGSIANLSVTVKLWSKNVYLWAWVTKTKPNSWIAWDNYAVALYEMGDYQGCIDAEKKSLTYFQKKLRPYFTIALCYNVMGERAQAQAYAVKAIKMKESFKNENDVYSGLLTLFGEWELKDYLAQPAVDNKKYNRVADILTEAIRIDPYNIHAPILLLIWCTVNEDYYLAVETARLMHARKFDMDYVRKKIKLFTMLTEQQKNYLDMVLQAPSN